MVVDQRNLGFANLSARSQPSSLNQWVRQILELEQIQVRSRSQGNNLHILLESQRCPDADRVMSRLVPALSDIPIGLCPADAPQIHRVVVYGREIQTATPSWTRTFYLNPPSATESGDRSQPGDQIPNPAVNPASELDQQNRLKAIAHHLSQTLSKFNIAIKVRAQPTPPLPHSPTPPPRLLITCEALYPPNLPMLAEPIAQRLRELNLQGFQDAIVLGQVNGEAKPEWLLRIDLTPPDQILREWARWGDVQALTRLLNRALQSQQVQLSALLKDVTLHLTCQGLQATPPDQASTIATVTPILDSLIPQGIQAIAVYGEFSPNPAADPVPGWVEWITIPTTQPTLELGETGQPGGDRLPANTLAQSRFGRKVIHWRHSSADSPERGRAARHDRCSHLSGSNRCGSGRRPLPPADAN